MIAPDTVLQNRYVVLEQIGQGGMGAVYVATDQRFGSTVALKETFFDDPALRKAFEREAHLLNRLRHPALPRVSDHFGEGTGQFLVMEFIPGDDLSEMLEKRGGAAFPLEQVLLWADQLLDALDYLHTHEPAVVHRDIKPQNLKLTSRNQIVLLDFGLAKGTAAALSRASMTGSVFGYSRNYAPLEQMQGTGTDPRSDIYSLAATLYHLLTGAVPPDALTRAMSAVNEQPDPLRPADEMHVQVTRSVAAALSKAMRQSSSQRFQTAEEMRAALRDAASRRAEEERALATVLTTTPGTAADTTPPDALHDQETQLLGGQTNARADRATRAAEADRATAHLLGTSAASAPDAAATLLGPGLTAAAGGARPPSAPAAADARADDSVVTRVRPVGSTHVVGRRGLSGRTLGAAASVLVLLVAAGAFYAFTRRNDAPQTPTTPEPRQTVATPEPQPSAQTVVEAAPTAPQTAAPSPAPASEAAPAQARQAPAAAKGGKRAEGRNDAVTVIDETKIEEQVRDAERQALTEVGVPEVEIPEHLEGMSPEERERLRNLPRRLRQMMLQQRRIQRQRQRALEEAERRRRQQQPLPPDAPRP
ncbi:MAG TPA: serine/threonine-protein kinase [Pyrinomonadaceae bacterium]